MEEGVELVPMSNIAGGAGGDNSTTTMKTMLMGNTDSRVVDGTKI